MLAPFLKGQRQKEVQKVGFKAPKYNHLIVQWARLAHAEFQQFWCKNGTPVQYLGTVYAIIHRSFIEGSLLIFGGDAQAILCQDFFRKVDFTKNVNLKLLSCNGPT